MSVIMIFTFLFILMAGYRYVLLLVLCLQTFIFKEAISIAHIPSKENQIPWFRSITWYFLFTITYFLYGESLIYYLRHIFLVDAFLLPLATHHRFISFCLYTFGTFDKEILIFYPIDWYILGLVLFVMNLRKGFYKFQFSQFAWTHMTLLLVTCQAFFIINNIFEGLFW